MLVQEQVARLQARSAMQAYHGRFDNDVYRYATEGKSVEYANALIDEALAICGHPSYKLSRRRWAQPAGAFLRLFPKEKR